MAAIHSTSSSVYPLSGLSGSNYDSTHLIQSKKPVSFELEHEQCKDESSSVPSCFPNPKSSQAGKDDAPQCLLDVQHDDSKDNLTPGKRHISVFSSGQKTIPFFLGPGAYPPPSESTMRAVYPSAPHYSLVSRPIDQRYDSGPGPGAYSETRQGCYKRNPPHYSFGIRHSLKKAPFIIEYKD